MSLRHPAYNLKVNKDADRAVLIEIARRAMTCLGDQGEYRYIGMGGPFLEDLKAMHSAFPRMQLFSIEEDPHTHKRQEFHRFINGQILTIHSSDVHDFIRNQYRTSGKEIFWLDYTKFGLKELNDFVFLSSMLPTGSIIRITICAQWLDYLPGAVDEAGWKTIYSRFRDKFGVLVPDKLTPEDFKDKDRYAAMLNSILIGAVRNELAPPMSRYFQPLSCTVYKDETQMLSLAGAIVETPGPEQQVKCGNAICHVDIAQAFKDWDLSSLDGTAIHLLDVPALSHKERLSIQRHLPLHDNASKNACINEFPYLLGNNNSDHERRILRYASLAPYYVQFAKMAAL